MPNWGERPSLRSSLQFPFLLSGEHIFYISSYSAINFLKRRLCYISCESELFIGMLQFVLPMQKTAECIQLSAAVFKCPSNLVLPLSDSQNHSLIVVICNCFLCQSFKLLLIFGGNEDSLKAVSMRIVIPADSLRNSLHIQNRLVGKRVRERPVEACE